MRGWVGVGGRRCRVAHLWLIKDRDQGSCFPIFRHTRWAAKTQREQHTAERLMGASQRQRGHHRVANLTLTNLPQPARRLATSAASSPSTAQSAPMLQPAITSSALPCSSTPSPFAPTKLSYDSLIHWVMVGMSMD